MCVRQTSADRGHYGSYGFASAWRGCSPRSSWILLALAAQSAVDQLDEVIALFDQAVSARESRARTRTDEELVERAKKGSNGPRRASPGSC